jgi:tRNA pseudouridine38-40 synthase
MRRPIQLVLSYDGTDFGGWQRQKNARSVQEELEKALEKMHGHPVKVTGAGRTDAGVHARGQAAGFFTDIASIPAEKFALALNKLLPGDIRIMSASDAPKDFHARFDASLRRYRYFISSGDSQDACARRYAWFVPRRPNLAVLNAMAATIVGEHDFTSFASAKDISLSRSRFIQESSFWFEGTGLVYQVSANAFLWRMVRSLVGTMLFLEPQAGSEAEGAALMSALLESRDRKRAGPTAPAQGLFLWNVEYGERTHGHSRRLPHADDFEGEEDAAPPESLSEAPDEPQPAAPSEPRLVPGLGYVCETRE